MMSTLSKVIMLAVGAAIGSAATWMILKTKYEKDLEEEVEAIKAHYKKKVQVIEDAANTLHDIYRGTNTEVKVVDSDPEQKEKVVSKERYSKVLEDHKYSHDEPCYDEDTNEHPYVISPDEFGKDANGFGNDHDLITLNYYADNILADDWNDPIEDVEATVGEESLQHFGEYDEDVVYVRNERLKVDYEILRSNLKFIDVVNDNPSVMKE